jgi:hypothetical protein
VCGLSLYPALLWGVSRSLRGEYRWLAASMAHLVVMTLYLAIIYRGSGNRARFAWLFPAAAGIMISILTFALKLCRSGRVIWRGTQFTAGAPPTPTSTAQHGQ